MQNPLDMSQRVVIVTGGSRGVGRGITECFLEAGAKVVICGRNAPDTLPACGDRTAVFHALDVRDVEQVNAFVEQVKTDHGRIDALINNAGGAPHAEAATASPRFHESIIRLNLLAPLNMAQAVNRVMQAQTTGGAIVNIASVSAVRPSPGTAAYGAAKAGLVNLTTSLAVEWAPKVRMNAIIAGLIETEQSHLHYGDDAGIAAVSATVPLGRMAKPKDIGEACLYLVSDLSAYVTGAALTVHGGGEKPAFLDAATAGN
ncbi:MAG TPA: SDR family oxidoreductase [Pseudomonadales bacterium]